MKNLKEVHFYCPFSQDCPVLPYTADKYQVKRTSPPESTTYKDKYHVLLFDMVL
jgi:hypothetical protein